jgi:hypothetical protein
MIESLAGVIKVEAIAGGVHNSSDVERASLSSQPAEAAGKLDVWTFHPTKFRKSCLVAGQYLLFLMAEIRRGTFH